LDAVVFSRLDRCVTENKRFGADRTARIGTAFFLLEGAFLCSTLLAFIIVTRSFAVRARRRAAHLVRRGLVAAGALCAAGGVPVDTRVRRVASEPFFSLVDVLRAGERRAHGDHEEQKKLHDGWSWDCLMV
jgi:uncharacterized membrane-anchored protein